LKDADVDSLATDESTFDVELVVAVDGVSLDVVFIIAFVCPEAAGSEIVMVTFLLAIPF